MKDVPKIDWAVVLSGNHPDIFVIVSAPENITDSELLQKAREEAMSDTYIWSKKKN
jgi:hypothetical protein